jgi:hypothetical protein
MRKLLTAHVAVAAIGTAAIATSSTADAGWVMVGTEAATAGAEVGAGV